MDFVPTLLGSIGIVIALFGLAFLLCLHLHLYMLIDDLFRPLQLVVDRLRILSQLIHHLFCLHALKFLGKFIFVVVRGHSMEKGVF